MGVPSRLLCIMRDRICLLVVQISSNKRLVCAAHGGCVTDIITTMCTSRSIIGCRGYQYMYVERFHFTVGILMMQQMNLPVS